VEGIRPDICRTRELPTPPPIASGRPKRIPLAHVSRTLPRPKIDHRGHIQLRQADLGGVSPPTQLRRRTTDESDTDTKTYGRISRRSTSATSDKRGDLPIPRQSMCTTCRPPPHIHRLEDSGQGCRSTRSTSSRLRVGDREGPKIVGCTVGSLESTRAGTRSVESSQRGSSSNRCGFYRSHIRGRKLPEGKGMAHLKDHGPNRIHNEADSPRSVGPLAEARSFTASPRTTGNPTRPPHARGTTQTSSVGITHPHGRIPAAYRSRSSPRNSDCNPSTLGHLFRRWTQPSFPTHLSGKVETITIPPYRQQSCRVEAIEGSSVSVGPAPSTPTFRGELAQIVVETIDMAKLRQDAPRDLLNLLDMLDNVHTFEAQLRKDVRRPPGLRRGTSRHMSRHLTNLIRWGVVRPTNTVSAITNLFTVPKKDGSLRLVCDGRKVNKLMNQPPKMDLPEIHNIIDFLLASRYFCTVDGKSFFYQFPISEGVGGYFSANLAGSRGSFTPVSLTRMPMGWSWAPAIAQRTANFLLQDEADEHLGKAWVDNFVFAGDTEKACWDKFSRFLQKADKVNLSLDSRSPEVVSRGILLGMEFDLESSRYRMAPSWVEELPHGLLPHSTPRQLYRITGSCIWSGYARRVPLCRFAPAIESVRRIATLIASGIDWDTPVHFNPSEVSSVNAWLEETRANEWAFRPVKVTHEEHVWSDASNSQWAWLREDREERLIRGAQGIFEEDMLSWHIFIKEAFAANHAVTRSKGIPRILMIDNLPLVWSIKKKFCSNKLVNSWFTEWDWENISVEWVPTQVQKADKYTRGITFSAPKGILDKQESKTTIF
jgi:hypothetical protein